MIGAVLAALSLASSLTLEVPYLPQTDALCGGAAVAMVFRYWGDTHADVQQFEPLVDQRAGGIGDAVLTGAVEARGWRTTRLVGTIDELRARVRQGQPIIVLLADRQSRYHYVVVVGATADHVIVHDPSRGPSRAVKTADFQRVWEPTNFWALLILPAESSTIRLDPTVPVASVPVVSVGPCDALLEKTIADSRQRTLSDTEAALIDVQSQCPASAGPLRELAGVRFALRRWPDAAALAERALAIDAQDTYAWDLLGSSRFMQDDPVGALRAWNRIGKPRVNLVRIERLERVRYQLVSEALGLRPNSLLTADAFERARRRLGELPDRATARLSLRPEADGFATVDVIVSERSLRPHGTLEWVATAARTAMDREVAVTLPGVTGQGELWTAKWRWWEERPQAAFGFAAPRVGGLPGVWRVDASWENETYRLEGAAPFAESRAHGGLTVSDWLTGRTRYSLSGGFDAWDGTRKAASVGGSLEQRAFQDRVALEVNLTQWLPVATSAPGFHAAGARALYRSSVVPSTWLFRAGAGIEQVGDAAPLAVWPGAGAGQARSALLRAHPLLDEGVIDVSGAAAFGRTLASANVEIQRWLDRPLLPRIGVAGFADLAKARRGNAADQLPLQIDVGAGLRVKIPGWDSVLRVDVAHGTRDGRNAITFGWLF
jgi:hypothetical protein